jgi:hypothetical protein
MKLRITIALAFLALPLTAIAQPPAPPAAGGAPKAPAWRQWCATDIEKHCKEADKTNTTVDCLAAHEKDLTDDCSTKFMRGYKVAKICAGDREKFCKDAPSLGQCFKDHDKDLSKECKAALLSGSKEHKAEVKAEAKEAKAEAKAEAKKAKAGAKKAKATKKEEK